MVELAGEADGDLAWRLVAIELVTWRSALAGTPRGRKLSDSGGRLGPGGWARRGGSGPLGDEEAIGGDAEAA